MSVIPTLLFSLDAGYVERERRRMCCENAEIEQCLNLET